MYNPRHLEPHILEASRFYPVVMVCGQRGVGKKTMLLQIKGKRSINHHSLGFTTSIC
jgi:predicted AAA+ superfamily ATPase